MLMSNPPVEVFVPKEATEEDAKLICEGTALKYNIKYKVVYDELLKKHRVLRSKAYQDILGMKTIMISDNGQLEWP